MKENAVKSDVKDKSALEGNEADNTPVETPAQPTTDAWKANHQKVSKDSPNLFSVTDDPSEKAMSGDGYSVKNGKINNNLTSFLATNEAGKAEDIESKQLKVVEHKDNGIVLKPGTKPKLEELVTEDAQGTTVTKYHGTIESPNISKDVSNKYLFADGGPNQNDVQQREVADCYFWSAVLQILAQDPSKFESIMKLNGDTVETTLCYFKEGEWIEETISRPIGIGGLNAQYEHNADRLKNRESGVRVDTSKPCDSAWNAVILGPICKINRTDYYKAALWANCLEQAYSDFARIHGQYGKGLNKVKDSGQEEFEFGCANECMHMFYGDNAVGESFTSIYNHSTKTIKALAEFKKSLEDEDEFQILAVKRAKNADDSDAHILSIENVVLCDKNGQKVEFKDKWGIIGYFSDLITKNSIDMLNSKVLIRNPWGNSAKEGKYFEVSLDNFLHSGEWHYLHRGMIIKPKKSDKN